MRLSRSWLALSLLTVAAVAALLAFVLRPSRPEGAAVPDLDTARLLKPAPSPFEPAERPKAGGVFDGTVVDDKDQPIPYATVILVSGGVKMTEVVMPSLAEPLTLPEFGSFGAAQRVKTDERGHFHAAAGEAWIVALIAYHRDHAPGILTGAEGKAVKPGEGLVVRLFPAGRLHGTVVDAVTKQPVAGADVAIFLQQKVGPLGYTPFSDHNAFAIFQQFLEKDLAKEIWGVDPFEERPAGLHVRSRSDGSFEFGPVTSEVQLEFFITHPEYAWTDMDGNVALERDNPDLKPGQTPVMRKQRMEVAPGKTVERTFELRRGKEISGRVVDETGRPLSNVKVFVRHIVQQAQYHVYREYARTTATDDDGRFRVAGLDRGPYQVRFQHEAFGTWYPPDSVKEGSKDVEFRVMSVGWIEGTLAGAPADKPRFLAKFVLEPATGGAAAVKEARLPVQDGKFKMDQVQPGTWRLGVEYQEDGVNLIAVPQTVVVESGRRADVELTLASGGGVKATLLDGDGRAVDPARVELEVLEAEGAVGKRGGTFYARQGVAQADCVLPGRYRAHGLAVGYVEAVSEPFVVAEGRLTRIDPLILHRQSFLQIEGVADEHGAAAIVKQITVSRDGGAAVKRETDPLGRIPVIAGRITVRAESADGRSFEKAFDVRDGETVGVRIVVR